MENKRPSPVVRRRRLALELRRLRTKAGKTLENVAEHMECSVAKVSRIESGQVTTRVQDVREMLECYGVTGAVRDELLELVRQARQKGWGRAYSDMIPEELQTMIGMEDEAATIWVYENYFIPGLLQTESYSRAIMTTKQDDPPELIERGLRLRTTRQAILTRQHAPSLWAVIDEAVLRRPVGGVAAMKEQYAWLVSLSAAPHITVQVLPFAAGGHAGGKHGFIILGFEDIADPKVVYAELLNSAYSFDKTGDVGLYLAQFDNLRSRALQPADSVAFIEHIAGSQG